MKRYHVESWPTSDHRARGFQGRSRQRRTPLQDPATAAEPGQPDDPQRRRIRAVAWLHASNLDDSQIAHRVGLTVAEIAELRRRLATGK